MSTVTVTRATQFVGRDSSQNGKRLFEILMNLKDFGKGRMVYRYRFSQNYPEPSYYIITDVDPDLTAEIPTVSFKKVEDCVQICEWT